jgi:tRNA threonylcarbamoyladenosine biosynthesis protein TsaE
VTAATQLISRDAATTVQTGLRIGERLEAGAVLSLEGVLGSGKTTFVKGLAQALAVAEPVTSPTFTLVSRYSGRLAGQAVELAHVDLYRIRHALELEDLGLEETMSAQGITVIEWGEKAAALLPPETIRIRFELLPDGARRILIAGIEL